MPTPKEIAEETMAASLKAKNPDAAAIFPHSVFLNVAKSMMDGSAPFVEQQVKPLQERMTALEERVAAFTAQMSSMNTLLTAISGSLPKSGSK